MTWTAERKREAAVQGPLVRGYLREDTRIIERRGWYQVVTPSSPGYINEIAFSQVGPEDAERAIDEAIATYAAHGLRFKWFVGPWTQPEGFGERLRRRGFQSFEMRGMGIDTAARFALPAGVNVVEIDASNVDRFVEATMSLWSMPADEIDLERRSHAAAFAREPRVAHFFGVEIDGEWVGGAALIMREGYGYLLGAQVVERMRGRGIYKALIQARLAALRARGFEYAVTYAQETTSAPILERLGFETLFRSTCWFLEPSRPDAS